MRKQQPCFLFFYIICLALRRKSDKGIAQRIGILIRGKSQDKSELVSRGRGQSRL